MLLYRFPNKAIIGNTRLYSRSHRRAPKWLETLMATFIVEAPFCDQDPINNYGVPEF